MKLADARILIVEDDAVMSAYVANSLRRMGVNTIEACSDGASGLKLVVDHEPDVILTDIHMKPMDGFEFVRGLRAHMHLAVRNIPVIFLSADASSSALELAIPLGVVGYIVKPPRYELLRSKLELALK